MLPALDHYTAGRSFSNLAGFLLAPGPLLFEQPVLKVYLWFLHCFLRLPYPFLPLVGSLLHLMISGMVWRVGRRLGLSAPAALLAGGITLVSFAPFHAYFWPPATQHLLAVLTVLGLLELYLKTESLFRKGDPSRRRWLWITWAAALLASLQRSTLMFPVALLADILFGSSTDADRAKRFKRWIPLFFIYPLYTLSGLIFYGDLVLSTALQKNALPGGLKVTIALAALAGALWAVQGILSGCARSLVWRRWARNTLIGAALLLPVGLAIRDHRQLLLPYNLLVPWGSLFGFFLDPLGAAQATDSTLAYQMLPPAVSLFTLFLSLGAAVWFIRVHRKERSRWLIPLAWGLTCLWYLFLHKHVVSSMPIRILSRYYIYLTPVFAWVAADGVVRVWEKLMVLVKGSRTASTRPGKRPALVAAGLVAALFLPNLLAIRFQLFRANLTNTYFAYDDIRTAKLLKESELSRPTQPEKRLAGVVLSGAVPLRFPDVWGKFVPVEPIAWMNGERFLRDELHLPAGAPVKFNPAERIPGAAACTLRGGLLLDEKGQEVERFWKLWKVGLELEGKDAQAAWEEAVRERPFLLKYLLGNCRLSDVRWMTDGRGLKEWIGQIERKWRQWSVSPVGKWERTQQVMAEELSAYAGCLVGLSFAATQAGREEEGRRWLSQLYFLEPDPQRLRIWLDGEQWLKARPAWGKHLGKVQETRWFKDPLPWQKDDFGFGRFLLRLVTGMDLRSRWERKLESFQG